MEDHSPRASSPFSRPLARTWSGSRRLRAKPTCGAARVACAVGRLAIFSGLVAGGITAGSCAADEPYEYGRSTPPRRVSALGSTLRLDSACSQSGRVLDITGPGEGDVGLLLEAVGTTCERATRRLLYYRYSAGQWGEPVLIAEPKIAASSAQMTLTADGVLEFFWFDSVHSAYPRVALYRTRLANKTTGAREMLYVTDRRVPAEAKTIAAAAARHGHLMVAGAGATLKHMDGAGRWRSLPSPAPRGIYLTASWGPPLYLAAVIPQRVRSGSATHGGVYVWLYTGSSWHDGVRVSEDFSYRQFEPQLRVDSTGRVHMVWLEQYPAGMKLFYVCSPDGRRWTGPLDLTPGPPTPRMIHGPNLMVGAADELLLTFTAYAEEGLDSPKYFHAVLENDSWTIPVPFAVEPVGVGSRVATILTRDLSTLAVWQSEKGFHVGSFGKYTPSRRRPSPPLPSCA